MSEILEDARYLVPEAPAGKQGMAWLRANASRFANGDTHLRRRNFIEQTLAGVDPSELGRGALRAGADGLAPRAAVVQVLAKALGIGDAQLARVAVLVAEIADAYLGAPFAAVREPADSAVEELTGILGASDERAANRIVILVQACNGTAALIEGARRRAGDPRARIRQTLEEDPPVPATRRVAPTGEIVMVELRGASAFGVGPRSCPGRQHALELAAGFLDGAEA